MNPPKIEIFKRHTLHFSNARFSIIFIFIFIFIFNTVLTPMPPYLLILLILSSTVSGAKDDHTPGDQLDLRSKPLVLVKIWCLLIVFAVTFVAGVSPYLMKWNQGFILVGTQFAGGVFLGTALIQFLVDSNQAFHKLSNTTSTHYPFAFVLASVGYLFAMLADCIGLHVYRKRSSSDGATLPLQGGLQQRKSGSNIGSSLSRIQGVDNGVDHYMDPTIFTVSSFGDSVLLIIALCFHSVFEGIAIGVANTGGRAWRVLWTVSLHKVFAAVAMGIAVLRMIPDHPLLSCAPYAFAFAISTPLGVAIGIVIDATTRGVVADWIYAVSMGLSCGVFIFVSVDHLISKGYSPGRRVSVDTPLHKFFAVLSGVGVIAVVMIWDT